MYVLPFGVIKNNKKLPARSGWRRPGKIPFIQFDCNANVKCSCCLSAVWGICMSQKIGTLVACLVRWLAWLTPWKDFPRPRVCFM